MASGKLFELMLLMLELTVSSVWVQYHVTVLGVIRAVTCSWRPKIPAHFCAQASSCIPVTNDALDDLRIVNKATGAGCGKLR